MRVNPPLAVRGEPIKNKNNKSTTKIKKYAAYKTNKKKERSHQLPGYMYVHLAHQNKNKK